MDLFGLIVTATTSSAAVSLGVDVAPEQLPGLISAMAGAFKSNDLVVGFGLLLMIVVAVARILGVTKLLDSAHDKWLAAGLAMLTSIGVGLQVRASAMTIISTALGTGLTAIGGWEVIGKAIRDLIAKARSKDTLPPAIPPEKP